MGTQASLSTKDEGWVRGRLASLTSTQEADQFVMDFEGSSQEEFRKYANLIAENLPENSWTSSVLFHLVRAGAAEQICERIVKSPKLDQLIFECLEGAMLVTSSKTHKAVSRKLWAAVAKVAGTWDEGRQKRYLALITNPVMSMALAEYFETPRHGEMLAAAIAFPAIEEAQIINLFDDVYEYRSLVGPYLNHPKAGWAFYAKMLANEMVGSSFLMDTGQELTANTLMPEIMACAKIWRVPKAPKWFYTNGHWGGVAKWMIKEQGSLQVWQWLSSMNTEWQKYLLIHPDFEAELLVGGGHITKRDLAAISAGGDKAMREAVIRVVASLPKSQARASGER